MRANEIENSGRPSWVERCRAISASKQRPPRKAVGVVGMAALLVFPFAMIYRIRELVAALLLFSVAFGVVIIVAFILWLAEEAAHRTAMSLESTMAHLFSGASRVLATARVRARHNAAGRTWN